jgi:hypothetical protein
MINVAITIRCSFPTWNVVDNHGGGFRKMYMLTAEATIDPSGVNRANQFHGASLRKYSIYTNRFSPLESPAIHEHRGPVNHGFLDIMLSSITGVRQPFQLYEVEQQRVGTKPS